MSLPTRFVKMAGGGNDFLLFEADGRSLSDADRRRIALLCRRGLSVGADGALFLSGGDEGRVHLDYFNADGGLASFCANGTRCAARYAVTRRLAADGAPVIETGWAVIPARVAGELVTLDLPPVAMPDNPLPIFGDGLPATGIPLQVGVPHLVVFVDGDLEELNVKKLGPPLRSHSALPDGANVNFVKVTSPHSIAVRTYERGVEAETLACGSGVVASAVTAARLGLVAAPVTCVTRSGVAFTVALTDNETGLVKASLTGDAREIFEAELNEEAWQE
jgi:diaminopimelate epimerase